MNIDSVYIHIIYKYSIYLYFSSQSVDSIELSSVPCVFTRRKMPIVIVQIKIEFSSLNFLRKWILGILFLILPKKHNYGDYRWITQVNYGRSLNSAISIPTRKFSIKCFFRSVIQCHWYQKHFIFLMSSLNSYMMLLKTFVSCFNNDLVWSFCVQGVCIWFF